MKTHTNILLEVATLSMRLSRKFLDPYSHPKSPHKFTQAQLMTCLVLKAYLKTTYRGVIDVLDASEKLRARIGLRRLPHYSTLKYFADRSGTLPGSRRVGARQCPQGKTRPGGRAARQFARVTTFLQQ